MLDCYLASASARRVELLEQIGVRFETYSVDVDETIHAHETPEAAVTRLAREKSLAGWQHPKRRQTLPVIGADTIVVTEQAILGKPKDAEHALAMLQNLSGATHQVMTAVSIASNNHTISDCSITQVRFARITDAQAQSYIATNCPFDKAGAYGIQGLAAMWIENIHGSYSGVMGLPLFETGRLLEQAGIPLFKSELS